MMPSKMHLEVHLLGTGKVGIGGLASACIRRCPSPRDIRQRRVDWVYHLMLKIAIQLSI